MARPNFDDEGNLIYPHIDEGIYKGFYDGGELDGTCVIGFNTDSDESIEKAMNAIDMYVGDHIHILGGDYAESGNDSGELIISEAEVLGVYEK